MPVEKLIRDGKVAVMHSCGYGGGWVHDSPHEEASLFDRDFALAVLGETEETIMQIAARKYPGVDFYGDSDAIEIMWIPIGTRFQVREYDGSEWIELESEQKWETA